jgi:hypothetical protein
MTTDLILLTGKRVPCRSALLSATGRPIVKLSPSAGIFARKTRRGAKGVNARGGFASTAELASPGTHPHVKTHVLSTHFLGEILRQIGIAVESFAVGSSGVVCSFT